MRNIFLHIGTHKTGSTSLQRWLLENEFLLHENGYELYHGKHIVNNHIELYLAAMRYERDSFAKQSYADATFDMNYTFAITNRVKRFLAEAKQENIIFSTEGLSLLRYKDELERLSGMLADSAQITIVVALRNRADYLSSYRKQLAKKKGRVPSKDYWSALYVEDDTWLTDYDSLLEAYRAEFGHNCIRVIDYDEQMRAVGNIIPPFLETIGLKACADIDRSFESYRDNQTLGPQNRSSSRK